MSAAVASAPAKKDSKDTKAAGPDVALHAPGIDPPLSPGPAMYKAPDLIGANPPTMTKAPAFSMSGRFSSSKTLEVPGPGAYQAKQVLGVGVPKYSLRARTAEPKSQMLVGGVKHGVVSPGPGTYTPVEPQPKKITMFPKHKDPKAPNYPGPKYEIAPIKTPGIKFGKEERGKLVPGASKQKLPDPGSYNLPGLIGHDSRKPNLKGGRDYPKHFSTPAPGAYNPVQPEKKGWTMGARYKQSITTFVSSTNPLGFVQTDIVEAKEA